MITTLVSLRNALSPCCIGGWQSTTCISIKSMSTWNPVRPLYSVHELPDYTDWGESTRSPIQQILYDQLLQQGSISSDTIPDIHLKVGIARSKIIWCPMTLFTLFWCHQMRTVSLLLGSHQEKKKNIIITNQMKIRKGLMKGLIITNQMKIITNQMKGLIIIKDQAQRHQWMMN